MQAQLEVETGKQYFQKEAVSTVREWGAQRELTYRRQVIQLVQVGQQGMASTVRRAASATASR
eukprot:2129075-Pyramimonas_sp.AAC.1